MLMFETDPDAVDTTEGDGDDDAEEGDSAED